MGRQSKISLLTGAVIAALLYLGCVVWDLLIPAFAMNAAWAPLFPGFRMTGSGFLLGFAESAAYGAPLGWFIAWIPTAVTRAVR